MGSSPHQPRPHQIHHLPIFPTTALHYFPPLPRFPFNYAAAYYSTAVANEPVRDLLAAVEREREREREQRIKAGRGTADIDAEDEEDYMKVTPLIEKLERQNAKIDERDLMRYEEPTDSESEDDERFTGEAIKKRIEVFERKVKRHRELLKFFSEAETLDDAFKWMNKVDKFENKHFRLRPEYRVIGELMNRLKVAEGKDKFILQMKLNRALRLVEWREAYDPNNPENYGVLQSAKRNQGATLEEDDFDENHVGTVTNIDSDEEEEYDDMKEKEDALLEKINAIDKQLEEKLAVLDHTFGRKGKNF